MTPTVSLKAVAEELGILNDQLHAYLNQQTGEIVTISDEEVRIVERSDDVEQYPEWQHEAIRETQEILDSEDWLALPSSFDIHEYDIMRRYCYSIEDRALSDLLLGEISRSGAFRRFKSAIQHHDIADDWYRYRQAALEEIAVDWLKAHGIPFS